MAFAICDFLNYDRRDFPEESLRGYYQCPDCGKWYSDNWITRHLYEAHEIDIIDLYLDSHPNESRYCKYCGNERYWEGRVYRLGKTCGNPECQRKSQSDTMIETKSSGFCGYLLDSVGSHSHYLTRCRIRDLMLSQHNRDLTAEHYLYLLDCGDKIKFGISLDIDGRSNIFDGDIVNYIKGNIKDIVDHEFNISMIFRHYLILNENKTNYSEFMDKVHLEEINGYFESIKSGNNIKFDINDLTN